MRRALAIVLAAFAIPAAADEILTKTGDVLVGEIVGENPDAIVIDSPSLGRITVRREVVRRFSKTPQAKPDARDRDALFGKYETPPTVDAATAYLRRINPLQGWETEVDLGYRARRGDKSDDEFSFRFRTDREAGGNEYLFRARLEYGEDVERGGIRDKTDQLFTAEYRYRHELGPRTFLQTNTLYYRDVIRELYHEGTQTVGLGLRFRRPAWNLNFTPAVGLQAKNIAHEHSADFVAGAYQDFKVRLTGSLTLRQNLYYLAVPDDPRDYELRFTLDVRQKLGSVWALGVSYSYSYDSIVGRDASKYQRRTLLTLGIDF